MASWMHVTSKLVHRVAKLTDWGALHQFLGDAIMWLAGVHAAAAIYHHVVLKDGVLWAMLPS